MQKHGKANRSLKDTWLDSEDRNEKDGIYWTICCRYEAGIIIFKGSTARIVTPVGDPV